MNMPVDEGISKKSRIFVSSFLMIRDEVEVIDDPSVIYYLHIFIFFLFHSVIKYSLITLMDEGRQWSLPSCLSSIIFVQSSSIFSFTKLTETNVRNETIRNILILKLRSD